MKIKMAIIAVSLGVIFVLCLYLLSFADSGHGAYEWNKEQLNAEYGVRRITNTRVKNYKALGEDVSYYTKVPQRVIAVGEQINETLVALNVESNVICAVRFGNPFYKPEDMYAQKYNQIKFHDNVILNMETVMSLEPDLIISGQGIYSDKVLKSTDFWHSRGVHTLVSANANSPTSHEKAETLEQEYNFILSLGIIFAKEDIAYNIVQDMKNEIKHVRRYAQGKTKQKVMIIEFLGNNIVAYDNSKLAGNICTQLGAEVPSCPTGVISLEGIIEENPDIIFVVKSGGDPELVAQAFKRNKGLNSLKAIKNNRVYGISLNYTYNSAIKTREGIKKFAKGIYPDMF